MKVNNWIWFDTKNEWVSEIKQDDLNYYTDMYSAWQTKQQLVIWREVKGNLSWWSQSLTFTHLASQGIWNQSFTWFWFKPTNYTITAWRSWDVSLTWTTLQCMSITQYWNGWVRIRPNWNSQIEIANTSLMIAVDYSNRWWLTTRATHSSFDNDWLTLNFSTSWEDTLFIITAFK